ncbi:CobW family GTP-binding protein [Phytohalomonas tamaricis]|uniref:CobW family GTP-binding protein n=1 Tax=Phytohalomonas tamaricis TaxID=2081032 RepID=UPI000D0BD268|nr:GTP-binding protein [Phytohalomonas tamaricis]
MVTFLAGVPTHIVTGFLGTGKTTFIRQLIAQKPAHERWALLVNEFGRIGIDQALFESRDDVVVKGLPGGCLCCQLAIPLQAGLVNLLHRARPDRLLIEPSGLGHPAGLLDVLRGEAFRDVLDIRDIITLVDARAIDDIRSREHGTFRDQLAMADAVVINKADLASKEQLLRMHTHLDALWPVKRWIVETRQGELPLERLLNGKPTSNHGVTTRSELHARRVGEQTAIHERRPTPGCPVREQTQALGHDTVGWCWHVTTRFDADRLTYWLESVPEGIRVKGVFHTTAGWYAYNRVTRSCEWKSTSWRKDSRLELIYTEPANLDVLEHSLRECLV